MIFLCLIGCKNKNQENFYSTNHFNQKIIYKHNFIDSLEGDFNFDRKIDIIRVEKKGAKLFLNVYENKSSLPKLSLKNIFYDIGDLKPTMDFIYLSFEKGNIILTQEYGTNNPQGWLICYVRNKNNQYIVDSISNSYKNFSNNEVLTKTKTINKNIKKINLIRLFDRLLEEKNSKEIYKKS